MQLTLENLFFRNTESLNWEIKIEHINALKNQIPTFVKGGYCDRVFTLSDKDIYEKYKPSNISLENFMHDISISLQLYVRTLRISDLSEDFIKEFEVKDYHIYLINTVYFNCYTSDTLIEIGDKRPFGNSWIEGDILEEVEPNFNDQEINEDGLSNYEKNEDYYNTLAWKVYDEVMVIFTNILKEFPIKYRYFEHIDYHTIESMDNDNLQKQFFNYNWTISKVYLRDEFINRILNDE